ncbi:hypothetical protein TNCT_676691 [Trichonephila clavata]|uniref:Uncharacterized protein n=1 Tax=Trichonephila clavata TaxID=2740835 RepID=A0A8X6FHZ2_TRICU|nr:hypothetical protein TNCT_676691 [Trichonephila clavata]
MMNFKGKTYVQDEIVHAQGEERIKQKQSVISSGPRSRVVLNPQRPFIYVSRTWCSCSWTSPNRVNHQENHDPETQATAGDLPNNSASVIGCSNISPNYLRLN